MFIAQVPENPLSSRGAQCAQPNISLLRSSRPLWDPGFYKHWVPPGPNSNRGAQTVARSLETPQSPLVRLALQVAVGHTRVSNGRSFEGDLPNASLGIGFLEFFDLDKLIRRDVLENLSCSA